MHILLAEDDRKLGKLIVHMLKKNSYMVDWVFDGKSAKQYARLTDYDLLILDWMMPGKSGAEVCRELRQEGYSGSVLMLTAKDTIEDKVSGLDAGADDYLVKPFVFDELFARIRALERRSRKPILPDILTLGTLSIDSRHHLVYMNGNGVQLTPKEYRLLELLSINHGQVLTREQIIERVWGWDADVGDNNLDALIRLLRKKLGGKNDSVLIENVRGVGYKLVCKDVS